jgi:hypothetical protein
MRISLENRHEPKPDPSNLYVHARIVEQLGYTDDAIALYRQVKPESSAGSFAPGAAQLAARRLKALGVKK